MKLSNTHLIRLTEIKQYLLSPPYTFRLHQEASLLLSEALAILDNYPAVDHSFYERYQQLRQNMDESKNDANKLRSVLMQIGRLINELTGR